MPKSLRVCTLLALVFGSFNAHATTLEIAADDGATAWSNKDGSGCANTIVKAVFSYWIQSPPCRWQSRA